MALVLYIMILAYSISRYYNLTQFGLYEGCEWYSYITFSIIHISFFHLAFNMLCLVSLYKAMRRFADKISTIIIPTLSVFIASLMATMDRTTVGCSGIIFSLLGMYTTYLYLNKIRGRNKFIILTSILVLFQTIIGFNLINWKIHLYSFALGVIFTIIDVYGEKMCKPAGYSCRK